MCDVASLFAGAATTVPERDTRTQHPRQVAAPAESSSAPCSARIDSGLIPAQPCVTPGCLCRADQSPALRRPFIHVGIRWRCTRRSPLVGRTCVARVYARTPLCADDEDPRDRARSSRIARSHPTERASPGQPLAASASAPTAGTHGQRSRPAPMVTARPGGKSAAAAARVRGAPRGSL